MHGLNVIAWIAMPDDNVNKKNSLSNFLSALLISRNTYCLTQFFSNFIKY